MKIFIQPNLLNKEQDRCRLLSSKSISGWPRLTAGQSAPAGCVESGLQESGIHPLTCLVCIKMLIVHRRDIFKKIVRICDLSVILNFFKVFSMLFLLWGLMLWKWGGVPDRTHGSSPHGALKTRWCSGLDLWIVPGCILKNKRCSGIWLMDRPRVEP